MAPSAIDLYPSPAPTPIPVLHDPVHVTAISQYDNWDHRECAVANIDHWHQAVSDYVTSSPPRIPRIIHQIWIGHREPPCVWLDTWRVGYIQGVGKKQGWQYKLWGNREVQKFEMVNRDLYDQESMWQCKADLLRLELLWKYGGVYIDADMVSLGKSLDNIIEKTEQTKTGFAITYEPDTKDKPYSVLGNSVIVASPGHPLVAMLIQYIKTIYHHKRPHHGVEWVTGPLAFTKVLVHTGMTFYTPPKELFYPQFHYVPNPDAIDMSCFPDAIAFQFGYTCSGLEDWVKNNNRCRSPSRCAFHSSKKDYPFGPLLKITDVVGDRGSERQKETKDLTIPPVIHQFYFGASHAAPTQWTDSWSHDFVSEHPGWTYKLWGKESLLQLGGFFATNLYHDPAIRKMDCTTLALLALEVLYKLGGFYVPLGMKYASNLSRADNARAFPPKKEFAQELVNAGGIIAAPPNSLAVLRHISHIYETSQNVLDEVQSAEPFENVLQMSYGDHICSYFAYPKLSSTPYQCEVGAVVFLTGSGSEPGFGGFNSSEPSVMSWAYQRDIPIARSKSLSDVARRFPGKTTLVVSYKDIALWQSLESSLSALLARAYQDYPNWQYLTLGVEWNAGYDKFELQDVEHINWGTQQLCGFVVRSGVLCRDIDGDIPPEQLNEVILSSTFRQAKQVIVGIEKVAQSQEVSRILRAMPLVARVLKQIADHDIPGFDADMVEQHGSLLKGTREGQLLYELNVDQELRIMYRSWNDDGGMNSEIKMNLQGNSNALVEWAKVYFAHQVIFEANGVSVSWI